LSEGFEVIVDAQGQIAGRLSSLVAKMLLRGKRVVVVNAEKAVISGRRKTVLGEVQDFLRIDSAVNPKYTPKHYIRPDKFLRSMIRGMLPRKKAKGAEALKRLRVHVGRPGGLEGEPITLKDTSATRLSHKYTTLQEVFARFGGGR